MYLRHERPLTDEERDDLRAQLADARGSLLLASFYAALLALVDGLLLTVLVLLVHGGDSGSTGAAVGACVAVLILHLAMGGGVVFGVGSWGDLRRCRASLADGFAVVERMDVRAAVELTAGLDSSWSLVAVGEGHVVAVPDGLPIALSGTA